MTLADILQDIEVYFNSNWSTTVIAWPNVPFVAPDGSWVRFSCLPDEVTEQEVGADGVSIRRGVVKVQIFTKPDIGSRTGAGSADTIAALFHRQDVGDVKFNAAYITDNGKNGAAYITDNGKNDAGTWYQHTVTAPWWAWVGE